MFSCSFCKMEFVRSVDLHRHVDAAHTIDDQMDGSFSDEKDNVKGVTIDLEDKSDDADYEPETENVKVLKRKAPFVKKVRYYNGFNGILNVSLKYKNVMMKW